MNENLIGKKVIRIACNSYRTYGVNIGDFDEITYEDDKWFKLKNFNWCKKENLFEDFKLFYENFNFDSLIQLIL